RNPIITQKFAQLLSEIGEDRLIGHWFWLQRWKNSKADPDSLWLWWASRDPSTEFTSSSADECRKGQIAERSLVAVAVNKTADIWVVCPYKNTELLSTLATESSGAITVTAGIGPAAKYTPSEDS